MLCDTDKRRTRRPFAARQTTVVVDAGLGCCVGIDAVANSAVVDRRGLGVRIREGEEEGQASAWPGGQERIRTPSPRPAQDRNTEANSRYAP